MCVFGLALTSFAFAGKYHRKGRTSVIPQISPKFGNWCEDVTMNHNPSVLGWGPERGWKAGAGAEKVRSHTPEAQDRLPSWGVQVSGTALHPHMLPKELAQGRFSPVPQTPGECH